MTTKAVMVSPSTCLGQALPNHLRSLRPLRLCERKIFLVLVAAKPCCVLRGEIRWRGWHEEKRESNGERDRARRGENKIQGKVISDKDSEASD